MSKAKKKIGMIVAIELDAFLAKYPDSRELETGCAFKLFCVERENFELYVLQCGMGEIAAAAGVQYLVSKCGVCLIANFGVVGGLTESMKKLKVCLVDRVVHYKYDCSEFMDLAVGQVDGHDSIYIKTDEKLLAIAKKEFDSIPVVACCSGDKFVGKKEEKSYIHSNFGGEICDMESAGIVLTCEINHIPCLLVKAVSDGLAEGAGGFYKELQNASIKCFEILDRIIEKIATKES